MRLLILLLTLFAVGCKKEPTEWKKGKLAERAFYDCEDIAHVVLTYDGIKLPKNYDDFKDLCGSGKSGLVGGRFEDANGKALFDYRPTDELLLRSKKLYEVGGKSFHVGVSIDLEPIRIYIAP